VLYAFFNAIGLLIAIGCLLVNDRVLGAIWPSVFHTQLASIVAKNGVGLVLGTTFRFWSYKRFVFPHQVHPAIAEDDLAVILDEEPPATPGPTGAAPAAPESAAVTNHTANGASHATANGGPNGKINGVRSVRPRAIREPAVLDE
jgi:hypothetical protein